MTCMLLKVSAALRAPPKYTGRGKGQLLFAHGKIMMAIISKNSKNFGGNYSKKKLLIGNSYITKKDEKIIL